MVTEESLMAVVPHLQRHCFILVDIGRGRTNGEGSYNGVCDHHQRGPLIVDFILAPADPGQT